MEAIRAHIRGHGAPGLVLAAVFASLGVTVIPSEPLTLLFHPW